MKGESFISNEEGNKQALLETITQIVKYQRQQNTTPIEDTIREELVVFNFCNLSLPLNSFASGNFSRRTC